MARPKKEFRLKQNEKGGNYLVCFKDSGSGGRWGLNSTRLLNYSITKTLDTAKIKWKAVNGGGIASEEYIQGAGPGTRGSTYVDNTYQRFINGQLQTLRIQTVSTNSNGIMIPSEQAAYDRIKAMYPKDYILAIPKGASTETVSNLLSPYL